MTKSGSVELFLPNSNATEELGARLAEQLQAGDCVLLAGPIGAGKTHLARSLIRAWLGKAGLWEDVPSPTYTMVQTYSNGQDEIWHADLYRLDRMADVEELGLQEAFSSSIVLVEWPDRLGDFAPKNALLLEFSEEGDGRLLIASGPESLLQYVKTKN